MNQRLGRYHGQSLVETALLMPFLIFLLIFTADVARAFSAYIEVGNMAREGVNFGSRSFEAASDTDAIRAAVIGESGVIFGVVPEVDVTTGEDGLGYEFVEVTIRYTFEPIFRIPPIPETILLQRTARMRIVEV